MKRVAVIGAGPAGLCSAKYLNDNPTVEPTIFEKSNKIGGTWVYTDITAEDVRDSSSDSTAVHSSMYKNLRTNTPKELMTFVDCPFPEEWPSYISHEQVLEYIQGLAKKHNIQDNIRFSTTVTDVRPVDPDNADTKWAVSSRDNDTTEAPRTEIFDGILICSGHHSIPRIPNIPGLSDFPGKVLHSHQYRDPLDFAGKSVIILGSSYSGQDISLDLARNGVNVIVSHRGNRMKNELHEWIGEEYEITKIDEDGGVVFRDGSRAFADVLLLCTGYIYSYPFMAKECKIKVIDNQVTPLYKHIFNASYPTMGFIGVVFDVCNFPTFSLQAKCFEAIFTKKYILPVHYEMMKEVNEDVKEKGNQGIAKRHFHRMADGQWNYYEDLVNIAGCDPFPSVMKKICYNYDDTRYNDLLNYREYNYKIVNDKEYYVETCE